MRIILPILFVLSCTAVAHAQLWAPDYATAQLAAEKGQKHLVIVFSGSDWCAPCIKLDREIWQDVTFQSDAIQDFVFYRADFPRKKVNQLPAALAESNASLAARYNPAGNFPLVVVLSPAGEVEGQTGYRKVSATEYLTTLRELIR